jgi:hypothetical protein
LPTIELLPLFSQAVLFFLIVRYIGIVASHGGIPPKVSSDKATARAVLRFFHQKSIAAMLKIDSGNKLASTTSEIGNPLRDAPVRLLVECSASASLPLNLTTRHCDEPPDQVRWQAPRRSNPNFKVALDCFAIARNDEPSFVTTGLDPVVHADPSRRMDCRII